MKLHRLTLTVCLALSSAVAACADDTAAAVITKARAYLGSDDALNRIEAVHYFGAIKVSDTKSGNIQASLDVIFQSPNRMLQVITADKNIETTGLDDYAAWVLEQDPKDPSHRRFTSRGPEPVARARANVWENLAFYRDFEAVGGHLEDAGTVTLDGQPSRKLVFWHDDKIKFTRWFDPATGQLRLTETDDGTTIREEGELRAAGVRFPKKIITTGKNSDGSSSTMTITFDRVIVNEPIAASLFAPPIVPPSAPAATPDASPFALPRLDPNPTPVGK